MVAPVVQAALVSGGAQILGGLLGGSAPKGPSLQEQSLATLGHERDSFNQKMKLAKDHGLHPLSVLGVPTANFSPAVSFGDSGRDYGSVLSGAATIGKSLVNPETKPEETDPLQARLIEANVRTAEANAKRAEWEALGSEFRVADMAAPQLLTGQPGSPPGIRRSNDVVQSELLAAEQAGISPEFFRGNTDPLVKLEQKVAPPHPRNLGHAAGTDQAWQSVMDKNGNPVSVVRNDAVNADIEKGATFQALAGVFGVERAMQITAVMENEGLIMGGALAAGMGIKKGLEYLYGRAKGKPSPNPRQFKDGKWKERR